MQQKVSFERVTCVGSLIDYVIRGATADIITLHGVWYTATPCSRVLVAISLTGFYASR